jgi:hypothetical protein
VPNLSGSVKTANNPSSETNKQPAFCWLGDEAEVQRLREESTHHYLRWTFFAVIAAVIVGLIAFGLTFLH